ncbi:MULTISPECIES: DUF4168 domain-containing protein [unclassified Coleofasciculus]|uniref:DUF4168 domain-containing protein n=1 Tax=unclassified Coleofasciculus TaxID=2692782 RepID=UPI001880CD23|nr:MULTISPECIES: DUF4168 domain-containing protein [unclassified Coleofasciculus]MBE9130036.1 DUF4168 domain-containing protein [Coleofasciculus sp. LEGE 07081]MBE9152386.1 DUF4168 domain-containing protein [Coleofasciculus sp. LEGE 07092]
MSKTISTLCCLAGLTIILSGCNSAPDSDSSASIPIVPAESVTPEEVQNYARAVMAIEGNRQEAYTEIQQMLDQEPVPDVTCTASDTVTALPSSVRDIAVNYCQNAKKIGESHGLTMVQFNTITASAQADPDLQRRIQNEMIRLQR